MSVIVMGLDTATGAPVELPITDGKLDVNATVEPAAGGATEAKQDATITAIEAVGAKLPAALHGGAGLKTGVLDSAGAEVFPPVATRTATTTPPAVTIVGAYMFAREPNSTSLRRVACDTSDRLEVVSTAKSPTTTSRTSGTGYEAQRGIDFAFSPWHIVVFSKTAGYVLIVDKSSDAADGDAPLGGHVYPIAANSTIEIGAQNQGQLDNCASGCQVVFSSTPHQVTLPGTSEIRITLKGV